MGEPKLAHAVRFASILDSIFRLLAHQHPKARGRGDSKDCGGGELAR
jgi:hypothetical protein